MPATDRQSGVFSLLAMAAFAVVWLFFGIYAATAVLMALFTAQLIFIKLSRRALSPGFVALWLLAMAMGGLTLLLRDKTFIQMKTTVIYAAFAVALLVADFVAGKNLPKLALGGVFDAPDRIWRRVSVFFAGYCLVLSAVNAWVARHLSEAVWVGVKTFGFPAATFLVAAIIAACLFRHVKEDSR